MSASAPVHLANRVVELYRRGGVSEVTRGVKDFGRMRLTTARTPEYQRRRTDNEERWAFVESHLEDDDTTLIDVGCAEGYLTAKAADSGLVAIGLDMNETHLENARERFGTKERISFMNWNLTPDTIDDLPPHDATLFFTVHHHWVRNYGREAAADMFRTLAAKSNKIFYEPPGSVALPDAEADLEPSRSVGHYADLLEDHFGDAVSVRDVTMVSYMDVEGRADPLFALDTSDYDGDGAVRRSARELTDLLSATARAGFPRGRS